MKLTVIFCLHDILVQLPAELIPICRLIKLYWNVILVRYRALKEWAVKRAFVSCATRDAQ